MRSSNRSVSPRSTSKHSTARSEERRVGKECRSRWSPYHEKKNAFEAEALRRGRAFQDVSPEQQDAILTKASTEQGGDSGNKAEWWFTVPRKDSGEPARITLRDHFDNMKGWVSGAYFFFSSRRRHTSFDCDWSSDVCSSDLRSPIPDSSSTGFIRR